MKRKCFKCQEEFDFADALVSHIYEQHPDEVRDKGDICTCGMTPEHPANSVRAGVKEASDPVTWCRARLLNWVLEEGMNLFHPPEGWYVFGHHAGSEHSSLELEFWGQGEDGLPLWEKPVS